MAKPPVDRIVDLLSNDALHKRIAAAIVLGELRAKRPAVVKALVRALEEDNTALQTHVLEALAAMGAKRSADVVLPYAAARSSAVRAAAIGALVSFGDGIVSKVEARLLDAGVEERKALDNVLARMGSKEAFSALLDSLSDADEAAANAAAVAMRQKVRTADAKLRRSYLAKLEKVVATQARRKSAVNHAAVRAALKMMGYLEDGRATATLLAHATSKRQPAGVRQEALISLRFIQGDDKPDAKLLPALVSAASDDDRALAQAALMTLAGMDLPARSAVRLAPLLRHPDTERARFVIDMLAHRDSEDTVSLLVDVLSEQEMRRARYAAEALEGKGNVASPLALALAQCADRERGQLMVKLLTPVCHELKPRVRGKLLDAVISRLEKGDSGWQSSLDIMRCAHPPETDSALRGLYAKLRRRKPPERATQVLRLLCRSHDATGADRCELGVRLLADSAMHTAKRARLDDESLRIFGQLLHDGFDLTRALRTHRGVDLPTLYYVGFHFIEEDNPAGEDLLKHVAAKGARRKIAKMAKNKLALGSRRLT